MPFDQCILDAGLAQGVALPHQCRGASCGQCKAHIQEGSVDHGWSFGFAITEEEKTQGFCLMCQAKPTSSELVIRTVQPFGDEVSSVIESDATVIAIEQLTSRVRRIVLYTTEAEKLFRNGAYAELELPFIQPNRMYSFSNAEVCGDQLEFLVSRHEEGLASCYLHEQIHLGQIIRIKGPFGSCSLPAGNGGVLGMAGGTGLAPVISIFEHALQNGSTEAFKLIFAVRTDSEIFELDRLIKMKKKFSNFQYELVIAEGDSNFCKGPRMISDHLRCNYANMNGLRAVMGGSPGFVDACTKVCLELGMTPEVMSVDSFTSIVRTS